MEENLTPAQREVQAEPTDAAATVGSDALAAAERTASQYDRRQGTYRNDTPAGPNPTLYIGNLYYEVTTDQIKRVFSRFGELDSVKIIYDNRGLSRGYARSTDHCMAQTAHYV